MVLACYQVRFGIRYLLTIKIVMIVKTIEKEEL